MHFKCINYPLLIVKETKFRKDLCIMLCEDVEETKGCTGDYLILKISGLSKQP